jgi:hypothetical protein
MELNIREVTQMYIEMQKMKDSNIYAFVAAEILAEIDNLELTGEELKIVLEAGLDVYFNSDYATTAGVGMSLFGYITKRYDLGVEEVLDFDLEDFQIFYYGTEWQ